MRLLTKLLTIILLAGRMGTGTDWNQQVEEKREQPRAAHIHTHKYKQNLAILLVRYATKKNTERQEMAFRVR